jgi:hypothetical protein
MCFLMWGGGGGWVSCVSLPWGLLHRCYEKGLARKLFIRLGCAMVSQILQEYALKMPATNAKGEVKKADAVTVGDYRIYTSLSSSSWRVLKKGERNDKAFKFNLDPEEMWLKLCKYLQEAGA